MMIKNAIKLGIKILRVKKITSALLDAEVLLKESLKKEDRSFLYAHPEYKLTQKEEEKFKDCIRRRSKREPIAYIINKKEFYGLDFYVDKRVFIPRPSSEGIIDYIKKSSVKKIIEVGTASGCIVVALAKNIPNAKICAIDISKEALKVAKRNAKKHEVSEKIKLIHGDLLAQAPLGDIIIANLPYLAIHEYKKLAPEIKKYEPRMALLGGKDGLFYYKKLLCQIEEQYKLRRVSVFLEMEKEKARLLKKSLKPLNLPSQWHHLDPYWTNVEFNFSLS